MFQDDIEIIERIASKYKHRYDNMSVKFQDKIAGSLVFVPIELTSVLNDLYDYKEAVIDSKDYEIHCSIAILNLYAHYKHFFQVNEANHVIIIGYVKDNYYYEKFKDVLNQLIEYCDFFPNVYTVPKILQSNHLYVHITAAIMCYMRSIMPKDIRTAIYVISNTYVDRQLMCLFPTHSAWTLGKAYGGAPMYLEKTEYMKKTLGKPEIYEGSPYKGQMEYMNVFIGRYFTTAKSLINKVSKQETAVRYITENKVDKYEILSTFYNGVYDPAKKEGISQQAYMYLQSKCEFRDEESAVAFLVYEKNFDFRFQNIGEINECIIPLLQSWKQKIKDYKFARESETYKKLIQHEMFSNWLMR